MADWRERCQGKLVSPEEAVAGIRSGEKVVFGMCSAPGSLLVVANALARRHGELRDVVVATTAWRLAAPWLAPGMEEAFQVREGFVTPTSRESIWSRRADYLPHCFSLSHPHRLLEPGRTPAFLSADWMVCPVSPPDSHGYVCFAHATWWNPTVLGTAKRAIGVVVPDFPWTFGDSLPLSHFHHLVEAEPIPPDLPTLYPPVPEDEARAAEVAAALASDLIRDGDTLEIGVGTISQLVPQFLTSRNDLGFHTEILTPVMVLDLMKAGVATAARKNVNPGRNVSSSILILPDDPRLQECLEFVDRNPIVEFRDLSYVCNHPVIASHDNMVAVNNAMAVDLQGQVIVEHLGSNPLAGLGGHLDFTIASHYSRGGRAVTLVLSTAQGGQASRIVPRFPAGAAVGLPGAYVDYLMTEHGVVNLEGKTRRQRAEAIISVAHPDFQPELRREAKRLFYPG